MKNPIVNFALLASVLIPFSWISCGIDNEPSKIKIEQQKLLTNEEDSLSPAEYLQKAQKIRESGDYESAKPYYESAAEKGVAQAHYALAYYYSSPTENQIYHLSEAAVTGHEKALSSLVDYYFYRGNNLTNNYTHRIYNVYLKAKEANPSIGEYNLLKMAAEVPELNGEELIQKYDLTNAEGYNYAYFIWEMAEDASNGKRFENCSPLLVLQLIIKGSFVPAEAEGAIYDYYHYWKQDTLVPFDLCNYITSGIGINYCSSKAAKEERKLYNQEVVKLKKEVNIMDDHLIDEAFKKTISFISFKAWNEECHDGSGYQAWANNSIEEQKINYLKFVKDLKQGNYVDSLTGTFKENDSLLNINYQLIKKVLEEKPLNGMKFYFTHENYRDVQRDWIPYRDINAKFFHALLPVYSQEYWLNFLTKKRLEDFDRIKEMIDIYKD